MYCKNCGKQISGDSKFCHFCGVKQSETKLSQVSIMSNLVAKINISEIKYWICGYGIWFVLNFFWLITGYKAWNSKLIFQPFGLFGTEAESIRDEMVYENNEWDFGFGSPIHNIPDVSDISFYDWSEFVVYVVGFPLIIWGVKLLIQKKKARNL